MPRNDELAIRAIERLPAGQQAIAGVLFRRERKRAGVDVTVSQRTGALKFAEWASRTAPHLRVHRYVALIGGVLDKVASGELKRVMIFAPPRLGKSELVSRLFPAYLLARDPSRWVAIASYSAELAHTLSRSARRYYEQVRKLSQHAWAVRHWETGFGGGLWACGVTGPATGKGYHVGIIDDPIKDAEQAHSNAYLEALREWWSSVWLTRQEPGAAIVLVQTRWSQRDLAGWLMDSEYTDRSHGWHIVALRAIAEEEPYHIPPGCTLEPDWRAPGEEICPERLPDLRQRMAQAGTYASAALYQQRPVPPGGAMFSVQSIRVVGDSAPNNARRIRWWDLGASESGDYTAGVLVATDGDRYWVEHVVRGRWTVGERDRVIAEITRGDAERYRGGSYLVGIPQDPGQAGVAAALAMRRMLEPARVVVERETGSKEVRAQVLQGLFETDRLAIVAGSWNLALIDELVDFPHGTHDDQVDALAMAVSVLMGDRRAALQIAGVRV